MSNTYISEQLKQRLLADPGTETSVHMADVPDTEMLCHTSDMPFFLVEPRDERFHKITTNLYCDFKSGYVIPELDGVNHNHVILVDRWLKHVYINGSRKFDEAIMIDLVSLLLPEETMGWQVVPISGERFYQILDAALEEAVTRYVAPGNLANTALLWQEAAGRYEGKKNDNSLLSMRKGKVLHKAVPECASHIIFDGAKYVVPVSSNTRLLDLTSRSWGFKGWNSVIEALNDLPAWADHQVGDHFEHMSSLDASYLHGDLKRRENLAANEMHAMADNRCTTLTPFLLLAYVAHKLTTSEAKGFRAALYERHPSSIEMLYEVVEKDMEPPSNDVSAFLRLHTALFHERRFIGRLELDGVTIFQWEGPGSCNHLGHYVSSIPEFPVEIDFRA